MGLKRLYAGLKARQRVAAGIVGGVDQEDGLSRAHGPKMVQDQAEVHCTSLKDTTGAPAWPARAVVGIII